MNWPGEKLVSRLWETLAEKGVGSLLKPWQIRRVGRAQLDVRRDEILMVAQASKDANDILTGKKKLLPSGGISIVARKTEESVPDLEAYTDFHALAGATSDALVGETLRKEINVVKAMLQAENELADDSTEPPTEHVNEDWLFRWRDAAGAVSNEELQKLWGRVLAGEVKAPGSVSLRTMEFLKNLTQEEAKGIERLASLVVANKVFRDDEAFTHLDVNFGFLLEMQELGIISGVESAGLQVTVRTAQSGSFLFLLAARDRGILLTHPDETKELKLPIYQLSAIGRQVLALGSFEANLSVLRRLGQLGCEAGFQAALVRCAPAGGGLTRYSEPEALCPPVTEPGATGETSAPPVVPAR